METNVSPSAVTYTLTNRYNVAPTYNQPVIRKIGKANVTTQDSQPPINTDATKASSITSIAKPGDLIVQSMRYHPPLFACTQTHVLK